MLTVWGRRNSVNVQKPMWLIGELGLAHQRIDVGGPFGGLDTPQYIAMNPNQVIPTLQDGEVTVWESEAVLRYLGSRYGEQYFPADPALRAAPDQWMCWVQSSWSPAMTSVFVSHVRIPRVERDPAVISAQMTRLQALATMADGFLAQRAYLAGDTLSLADFSFGAFLYRYFTLEIDRPDLPALRQYYDGLSGRPAYVEHVHIDYDPMRVPGAERQ